MAAGAFAAFGASSLVLRRLVHADDEQRRTVPAGNAASRTPSGDLGPFYPVEPPLDTDFDLTRVRDERPSRAAASSSRSPVACSTAMAHRKRTRVSRSGRPTTSVATRTPATLAPTPRSIRTFRATQTFEPMRTAHFRILTVRPGLIPCRRDSSSAHRTSTSTSAAASAGSSRRCTSTTPTPTVLAQDKLLQHDMWGKTNPLPSTIFAKLQKERSTLDASARTTSSTSCSEVLGEPLRLPRADVRGSIERNGNEVRMGHRARRRGGARRRRGRRALPREGVGEGQR